MRPPKRYHKITRCSGMPVACPSCLEGCRASGLICRDFDFRLLSGPGARPGMGPMEGEEEPLEEETQSKKGKKKEGKKPWPKKAWRPWRDRISDQQDAVLFVQSFVDVAEQLSRLLTVSANGVAIGYMLHEITGAPVLTHSFRLSNLGYKDGLTAVTSDTSPDSAACCELEASNCLVPPAVLYGGDLQGRVFAWSSTGALLAELSGHTAPITVVRCLTAFGASDQLEDPQALEAAGEGPDLATASVDGTIRVWHTSAGLALYGEAGNSWCLFILELGHRNPVSDMVLFSCDEIAVSTWDGQIRWVDLTRRCCSKAVQATQAQARALCKWRKNQEWQVFVGMEDGTIACWANSSALPLAGLTTTSMHQRLSWQGHFDAVIALSTCKDWVVSLAEDKLVRLWEASSGKLLADLWGHGAGPLHACVSKESKSTFVCIFGSR
ncbi:unnamed protein product [Effrenium voratum]|uniref:Uncharacterized protein n=1 Tax=Effrenium voratum TaxID=2562239 RepID=A0AA36MWL4_9DINO|nr:unnamed protein product [Effrenium voratum]